MKKYALAVCLAACVHLKHVDPEPREGIFQSAAVAQLEIECDFSVRYATGVVISERHIITAAHAVRCGYTPTVHATLANGRTLRMTVAEDWTMFPDEYQGQDIDVAKLELASADWFGLHIPPPTLADGYESDAGFTWCAATTTGPNCGNGMPIWNMFKARSKPGDSGSGVYDEKGRLLGIVVTDIDDTFTRIEPSEQKWLEGT